MKKCFAGLGMSAAVLCSAMILGGAGCASTPDSADIPYWDSVPMLTTTLVPGNEVDITFFGAPDLNVTQTIRNDGRISLKLVEEVLAAGKTPSELEKEIAKLYESQLQIKAVNVVLRSPPPVYVTGSVLRPGKIDLDRQMTVLEAIMSSGGFDPREAEVRSVVLIRHENGKRLAYSFDFKGALAGEAAEKSFFMRPFDIVYVPRTRIVKIGQWVDQHITQLIPVLGVSYDVTDDFTVYR